MINHSRDILPQVQLAISNAPVQELRKPAYPHLLSLRPKPDDRPVHTSLDVEVPGNVIATGLTDRKIWQMMLKTTLEVLQGGLEPGDDTALEAWLEHERLHLEAATQANESSRLDTRFGIRVSQVPGGLERKDMKMRPYIAFGMRTRKLGIAAIAVCQEAEGQIKGPSAADLAIIEALGYEDRIDVAESVAEYNSALEQGQQKLPIPRGTLE